MPSPTMSLAVRYPTSNRLDTTLRAVIGDPWDRLDHFGWSVAASDVVKPASAWANPYSHQIVCRKQLETTLNSRQRWYVLPHEVGHALDFAYGAPSGLLAGILGLDRASAQETLGEAIAYRNKPSKTMRAWVIASINWHCRVRRKWKYTWSHVTSPATTELASMLLAGPSSTPGTWFEWDQERLVRVAPPPTQP